VVGALGFVVGVVSAVVVGVVVGGERVTAAVDDGEGGDCEVGDGLRPHPTTTNVAAAAAASARALTDERGPDTGPILVRKPPSGPEKPLGVPVDDCALAFVG
jgi:hypothetical protein